MSREVPTWESACFFSSTTYFFLCHLSEKGFLPSSLSLPSLSHPSVPFSLYFFLSSTDHSLYSFLSVCSSFKTLLFHAFSFHILLLFFSHFRRNFLNKSTPNPKGQKHYTSISFHQKESLCFQILSVSSIFKLFSLDSSFTSEKTISSYLVFPSWASAYYPEPYN